MKRKWLILYKARYRIYGIIIRERGFSLEQKKMQMNIGICDDEPAMLMQLEKICTGVLGENYELHLDSACSASDLLSRQRPFQIALLDVQLVETSGIELARKILERNSSCRIIFVSGYLHAVSDVYEVPHFGFVLKSYMEEQLPRFLLRAAELSAKEAGQRIMIACGRKMEEVSLSDIITLERRGHITTVRLRGGEAMQTKEKLSELLLRIRDRDFLRCHVSFAVNLQYVSALEGSSFLMDSGEVVPISRPNESICREAFFRHLEEVVS